MLSKQSVKPDYVIIIHDKPIVSSKTKPGKPMQSGFEDVGKSGKTMANREMWLEEDIFLTVWEKPLFTLDLRNSFEAVAEAISSKTQIVHVLFDVQEAGNIPLNAPYLALRSGFMTMENLGLVAVVGMDRRAQVLADMVVKVVKRNIIFFPTYDEALRYLKTEFVQTR